MCGGKERVMSSDGSFWGFCVPDGKRCDVTDRRGKPCRSTQYNKGAMLKNVGPAYTTSGGGGKRASDQAQHLTVKQLLMNQAGILWAT